MNILLWLLQALLALAFLAHGLFLLFPPASMIETMNTTMSTPFRIFLGIAEVVAAVGLTLPGITRIQPWWTQWAALGLMVVMAAATVFHVMRAETSGAVTTAILFAMAAYVGYMRWRVKPILPRTAPRTQAV